MSSGEDWTHHWIMTSMGPSTTDTVENVTSAQPSSSSYAAECLPDDPSVLDDPLGMAQIQAPDECVSASPVTSIDLDRESPMALGIDEDDAGPPSIETQPPDNSDIEVSGITSTWIVSGGHYGSNPSSLRLAILQADLDALHADSTGVNTLPGLDGGEFDNDAAPVCGPALPVGPFNSPVRELSPIHCGDITDETATIGLCGLRNLGNTCFMAAGLQCLVNTPPIAQYFFNHHLEGEEAKKSLVGCFSQLTHKIWSGKYSSLRPADFKEAFGTHWRDFRDYRQHDCQEFMTLLLEALRKQMPLEEEEPLSVQSSGSHPTAAKSLSGGSLGQPSCTSSVSSRSSNSHIEGSRGSRGSLSPSPPQSPQGPPSPLSPSSMKQPNFELRNDNQEDPVGLDSGAASPKSSVSSSSVDAHLISLRLQPIPEEVKTTLNRTARIDVSSDDISVTGTMSCQDAESVTSDMSDSVDGMSGGSCLGAVAGSGAGVASVRRYNHLSSTTDYDMPSGEATSSSSLAHCLSNSICDSSSSSSQRTNFHSSKLSYVERNEDDSLPPQGSRQLWNLPSTTTSDVEKNDLSSADAGSSVCGSSHLSMVKLEDIMKETKTSNVNVLAKDNVSNNKFLYDSEKYARVESKKLKNSVDNLSRSGLKRVKEVNLLVDKMDNSQLDTSSLITSSKEALQKGISSAGRNSVVAFNKRIRLEEKNVQYEMGKSHADYLVDRLSEGLPSTSSSAFDCGRAAVSSSSVSCEEQKMADECWKAFVGDGKSAVVDTFYGQFKSSLVCSVCGHTSVKFDPFGTLSVPLPHANELQIPIIFVPHNGSTPTRFLITLFKASTIQDLKVALCKLLDPMDETVVIAEVFDNHIARTVEESYLTKFLNLSMRSIYAFELAPSPIQEVSEPLTSSPSVSDQVVPSDVKMKEDEAAATGEFSGCSMFPGDAQWQACNICLEELCQTDLKTHKSCEDCVLCDNCIEMSCKHHGAKSLPCPVCHTHLSPCDLIPVAKRKTEKPKARILRVPVVFRLDTQSDDNNKREMQLLGHPCLLSLPSRLSSTTLSQIIEEKLMPGTAFSLLLVDGRGYNCSRCLFSSHCRGCEAIKEGESEVVLHAGDTLCIRFKSISPKQKEELGRLKDHRSMSVMRPNEPLTLYDCLRAFTHSETLEDSESWYCPKCERKQQATKTISVWKYPPYLIIHLERFLFDGAVSTKVDDKVIFPIDSLDLSDFVAGGQRTPLMYNLYSCVCHMGVAQAGHYTALVRSPVTGEWHYFNDDCVTRQKPRDEEYSTSYLLFYHRQGTKFDLCLPSNMSFMSPKGSVVDDSGENIVGSSSDSKMAMNEGSLPSVSSIVSHALPHLPLDNFYPMDTSTSTTTSTSTPQGSSMGQGDLSSTHSMD